MKHFLLQFKPYCIIAEKQPIPTNDRKGRHINESVHLKLMRFTKPPRENNIRHLSWFSYALDIMIKHLLQPTATQVTWRTCREKTVPKRETGRSALEVPVTHTSAVIFRSYVDSRNDQCNHLSFQGIVTRIFRQLYKIESVWNFHRTGDQVEKLLSTLQNTRGIAIAKDLKLLKSQQRRKLYFSNKNALY